MQTSELLLYRLNFVDHSNLFHQRPLRTDRDFLAILSAATQDKFDRTVQTRTAVYVWALRDFHADVEPEEQRAYAIATLARSTNSKLGPTVTSSGIEMAKSESSPPLAQNVLLIVDLKKHIIGVEYSSYLMQSDGWRTQLEALLSEAASSAEFSSSIRLEPIQRSENFEEQLSKFQRVTRILVKLAIPNPDIGPTFKRLYEEMQQGDIRELKQDMSNPAGMKLEADSLPRASLDMALTGYREGPIQVEGLRDGAPDKIVVGDGGKNEEVARVKVEGVREFASGFLAGSPDPDAKKIVRLILKKLDELLE